MPEVLRRIAAAALLAGVLGIAWAGLYEGDRTASLVMLAIVAALPALADLSPRSPRVAAAAATALALLLVAAMAAEVSVWSLVGFSGDAWSSVVRLIPDGMAASSSTSVPASPAEDAAFVGLLDAAYAALVAGAAWQLVARQRPGAAVVLAGLGLAYRWTVEAPQRPVLVGTLALGALITALALGGRSSPSPRGGWGVRVGAAGMAAVLGAALLAPGAATQDRGWWDWRTWSLTGGEGGGTGLDIRQTYGQLDWPATPRVVMRVQSAQRLPLRAAVLSDFDGSAFSPALDGVVSRPLQVDAGRVFIQGPPDGERTTSQSIRFESFRSTLVLAGGSPLVVSGRFTGIASLREGGTVQVDPSLGPGTRYTAFVAVDDASPRDLVTRTAYSAQEILDSTGLTGIRPSAGAERVDIPMWGAGGVPPSDAALGAYAPVRAQALRVIGDAASPYVAVNRIEAHLRIGFAYDEAPPFPQGGEPPLTDFLFSTRRGFCQHFAGSMALMLRSVGIPARIAVGYTAGRLDPERDEYVVLDRDAHSWVEAYLPGVGWVDFDPTPGRAVANRASVSSPRYDPPPAADPTQPEVSQEPVAPVSDPGATPTPLRPEPEPAPATTDPVAPEAGGRGVDPWVVGGGGALALLLLPGTLRGLRRARARRSGDERARVLGAVADLESTLRRTGAAPPEHGDAVERAAWLRANTGLDARRLYALAQAARYAPGQPAAGSAREAWTLTTALRRRARRRVRWPRRAAAYLGVRPPDRGTLTA